MKTKLIITCLLTFVTFAFVFNSSPETPVTVSQPVTNGSNGFMDSFFVGIMDNGQILRDYNRYKFLNVNLWEQYPLWYQQPYGERGWTNYPDNQNDMLFNDVDTYKTDVLRVMDDMYNYGGMRTLIERPKIRYLAYGSRSDYQAESETFYRSHNNPPDKWFYTYNNSLTNGLNVLDMVDNTQWGLGANVKHCFPDPANQNNGAGYILSGLKTNREQIDMNSVDWIDDYQHKFFVRPRIRIKPEDAFLNKRVCKIEILRWDGQELPNRSVEIYGSNFINQGSYDGNYLEKYIGLSGDKLTFGPGNEMNPSNPPKSSQDESCQADFRVLWYGECEMWIDYVRVEDEVASRLLTGNDLIYEEWLKQEAQQIAALSPATLKFYIEEWEFNQLPCMAYVSERLKYYSQQVNPDRNINLACLLNYGRMMYHVNHWWERTNEMNIDWVKRNLVDKLELTQIIGSSYPIAGSSPPGCNTTIINYDYPFPTPHISKIPITLPISSGPKVLATAVSPAEYDQWLQNELDYDSPFSMTGELKRLHSLSANDRPFIHYTQVHQWKDSCYTLREPTNEEIEMMVNLPISYGAKGISYFWYGAFIDANNPEKYGYGLTEPNTNFDPRHENFYGQYLGMQSSKYNTVAQINGRLRKWGQYLMQFSPSFNKSYIYRTERTQLLNETYFNDIRTYTPDINNQMEPSNIEEPVGSRYLQAAVFEKFEEPYSNYFMFVNRRCSPYFENGDNGGRRYFKVSFKESELQYFTNWKIVDLENNNVVTTFNKNGSPYIDLGWYKPGEGKLYKLAPVMVDGGTLTYDENLNMTPAYECYNTVYNGGKNISLYPSNNITFTHLGRIVMNGGSFQSGLLIGDQGRVTLFSDGINTSVISFENCTDVRIYNTDVSSYYNTSYLFSITNCTLTDIQNSSFTPPENGGGIGFFAAYSMLPPDFNLNISNNNHFNMAATSLPALNIMAFGGVQIPLLCTGNYFTSQGNNSTTAINLLNVSGGILQNNSITGFYYGINALTTNTALYHNNISSSGNTSYGLNLTSGTVVDMSYTGDYLLGANVISNTGSTSSNIYTDNSYYLMNTGYNIFNISANSGSYHLSGTFPLSGGLIDLDNKLNCFKQNQNNSTPVKSVNWYSGSEVQFNFLPYSCNDNQEEDGMAAADMGDGIIDSIAFKNGTPMNVYDSLGLEMRRRNYAVVINMCTRILNDPPDTIQIIDAVSKLYMATISTDTTETGITSLKDFYLNVIMNNPSNSALVRNCNYYVQKCKVNLRQYSSALSGFQQIITENPYSYEALVAHWDYMAVYILDSLSGGSEMGDGDDRNSKLTKEQKIYVKEVIRNIYENERKREENNINILTAEVNNGNEVSKVILGKKRTLKEVVQNQTPHTMFEHLNIVNNDIKKVFGKSNSENHTGSNNLPMVFRISQNYPNPFNPTTKINYDLPKDSKVKIVIYDILGREVKRLVNNELKTAGSYIVDFNASNYASGVYFYRIEAEEPNGSKFVDSKKMVLLK